MRYRVRASLSAAAIVTLLCAHAAHAGTVPAGSVVRVDRTIDVAAFVRTIAARYQVVLERAVAADIDRDGDLDVVAATDRGFLVWVNDGNGQLTSQTPRSKSGLAGGTDGDTWSGGQSRHDETIQNDLPSSRLPSSYAHAPPLAPTVGLPAPSFVSRFDIGCNARVPRAPPASTL